MLLLLFGVLDGLDGWGREERRMCTHGGGFGSNCSVGIDLVDLDFVVIRAC